MTGTADQAAIDRATLAIRRAAVRAFLRLDRAAQRRAVEAATDDPATVRQAMRMIDDDAQHADACRCCTPSVRLDPKQAPRPPEQGTPQTAVQRP